MNILLISLGGALGAISRYFIMSLVGHFTTSHFPYATIVVNVSGSFLLGITVTLLSKYLPAHANEFRLFIVIGFFGAFTTFSTFSLDTVTLLEEGVFWTAIIYGLLSIMLGIFGLFSGLYLARFF